VEAVVTYGPIGFIHTPFKDIMGIKPYVPLFDTATDVRTGWFNDRTGGVFEARADGRFRAWGKPAARW
jgi:hypothetical protein